MRKEIESIADYFESVNSGEPWFGRATYEILDEVDPAKAFLRPGNSVHSMADILYHMITWVSFTQKRIERDQENDMKAFEKLDWRKLDPAVHGWEEGVKEFKKVNAAIAKMLREKDDSFLNEKVDYRTYDFRYLMQGIIEHNIYHIGQIALLNKMG